MVVPDENEEVRVRDIDKRWREMVNVHRVPSNIEHLVSGIYLVHIDSGNSQLTKRFVVE